MYYCNIFNILNTQNNFWELGIWHDLYYIKVRAEIYKDWLWECHVSDPGYENEIVWIKEIFTNCSGIFMIYSVVI